MSYDLFTKYCCVQVEVRIDPRLASRAWVGQIPKCRNDYSTDAPRERGFGRTDEANPLERRR
jgi:hypothetical protein